MGWAGIVAPIGNLKDIHKVTEKEILTGRRFRRPRRRWNIGGLL
jgi:hypothetical protein